MLCTESVDFTDWLQGVTCRLCEFMQHSVCNFGDSNPVEYSSKLGLTLSKVAPYNDRRRGLYNCVDISNTIT